MSQRGNLPEQDNSDASQERFPEPQTFPTQWAESEGYMGDNQTTQTAAGARAVGAQSSSMNLNGETEAHAEHHKPMETFPQPRTFPKRWRLSGSE